MNKETVFTFIDESGPTGGLATMEKSCVDLLEKINQI